MGAGLLWGTATFSSNILLHSTWQAAWRDAGKSSGISTAFQKNYSLIKTGKRIWIGNPHFLFPDSQHFPQRNYTALLEN